MKIEIHNIKRNKRTGNLHGTLVINGEAEIGATLDYIISELEKGRYVGPRPEEREDDSPE